jgi:glucose/arabinose dehydrogenase
MSMTLTLLAALACAGLQGDVIPSEADYYTLDYLVPPEGARLEVGGMDFLPDGSLAVSTRRGQVWIVEDPLAADPRAARFRLFAEGLQEGLGLAVVDGEIVVLQRGELSRLLDTDGDGACDTVDTLANDWGNSGHYHEFAFGLPRDREGSFYIALNVSFGDPHWWHGRSTAPYRGWVMRIAPDGRVEPFASGVRSPCGLGTNAAGDLFLTDNQGDWVPACPIVHVERGAFYGHPASLNWTDEYRREERVASDTVPPERERDRPAVWIPYDWSRSAGSLTWDSTQGRFGPFEEQLFVAELTNGLVLRAQLERVQGDYQGAVFPFRSHVGSAVRVVFAGDGTLFTGFTDRGWGGQPPADGIGRIRWSGKVPMEMRTAHLLQDGFEIEFTKPLAAGAAIAPEQVELVQYDYDWWWEYGSPTRHEARLEIAAIEVSADRTRLTVRAPALQAGMVARMRLLGILAEDGTPLLHEEMAYTVNELPEGPRKGLHVAKRVPPPPARERWEEGVLMLSEGDALDVWKGEGWRTGAVKSDPSDPARFVPSEPPEDGSIQEEGELVLSNVAMEGGAERAGDLVSRLEFGDCDVHVDFMIPKGGNSGVYLMGRYEVQILDSAGKLELAFSDCGGIYQGWGEGNRWPGRAPSFNAFRGPGRWHGLDIRFRAPRFDERGVKIADARFERVMIDDTLLHENVEVPNPTRGGYEGELARGPLRLQGDHGPVAYRSIRVRPRGAEPDAEGWERIFDGKSLEGWKISDDGAWRVEDGMIVGSGAASHLFSPRGDYRDFEFRAKAKINDGGNSGMYFRVAYGSGWPTGYEAQVNSTHTDKVKTGSLYRLSLIKAQLVPPDTWFTQHVVCRDEPEGVHVKIYLNGVLVNDYVDRERRHSEGHVAFQQHHDGSVVHYKDVEVRELR